MSGGSPPQTVFITGGNRGIGLELVKQLTKLKEPPKIIIATYRNPDGAKELLELAETNKSIRPIQFDVRDIEYYAKVVDDVSSIVGSDLGINLLVNNAGICPRTKIKYLSKEEMLETYEVNAILPTLLTRAFVPLLKKGFESSNGNPFTWSRSAVINISSYVGSITRTVSLVPHETLAYRMSKAALNMATKVLSLDLKQQNSLVISIHPGWVKTDMGGPNGRLELHESISMILSTFAKLTVANNGGFFSFSGEPIEY